MKQLIIAFFMTAAFASCEKENLIGSGNTQTELRPLTGFSKIDVSGKTDVTVNTGSAFKVEVKAYSNLLRLLETKVVNGTLKIGYKNGTSISNDNSEVIITLPALSGFYTTGSSDIALISGNANDFEAVVIGTSTVKGFGFTAKQAIVKMEGSCMMELSVTDKLSAKITGSGIVYYKGNPSSVTTDITGSGKVEKR